MSAAPPPPSPADAARLSPEPGRADQQLAADLAALPGLDLDTLRALWRRRLRGTPPALARPLLVRLLAYRLQARAFGDLDPESARALDRVAKEGSRRRQAGEARSAAVPPVAPVPRPTGLKPGTVLMREHGGETYHVTVVAGGFAWRGATYASLSEIARAITGTRWNGPRFFGLREPAKRGGDGAAP
ncbi:DUF2924 domain-containing protein [Lichenibacterium dinghuense]|uniref:DUF2924 domain-containing protein n=1 Tax=Lichenibacterium dinghuense TaxID=2895977 RepID=UPI001F41674A|nr:DUF2924 domain-containing protein [Lichenibacterium sp. 6Y81]